MSEAERAFPRIVRRRLAPAGTLAGDALAGRSPAAGLFASPPGSVPTDPVPRRPLVGTALPSDAFTATSEAAAERLELILAGEGIVVTAGQQPGLLMGPLYTLYKALTAVRVASELEARHGLPTLAVFWVASDDHDWDEVAVCRILDAEESLITLRLEPPPGHAGRSVGEAPLPAEISRLLDRFKARAGGAVVGAPPPWLGALCEAYRPGRTFGEAFVRALAAAAEGSDLAILDAAHPALRERAAELYGRVIEDPGLVTDAMRAGRERVAASGYQPSLTPPPEGLQMFYDDGKARRHVIRVDAGFDVGEENPVSKVELLERLQRSPVAFTPAAGLRPAVESALLPVVLTVLGPGEISYWAQLLPVFEALEIPMPAIVGRDAWTLVEPRVDRLLEKLGLDVEAVETEGEGIDDRWIARARPSTVREAFSRLESAREKGYDALAAAIEEELPGITSAVGKARHRSRQAVEDLSRTVDGRIREREAVALAQAARVRAHLTPGGQPQERVVAAAQFLARHGGALVRDLMAAARVAGAGEPD